MRILHVNNCLPSASNPNMATYVRAMTECMRAAGHEVDELGITYEGKPGRLKKLAKYLQFWLRCFTRPLGRYDLVYVNHPPFCLPIFYNPTRRARKTAVHWHGNDLVSESRAMRMLRRLLRRRVGHSRQLAPSQYFKDLLSKNMGYEPARIAVTPSGGVDTALFAPREHISEDQVIGFPGELISSKGADTLVYIAENRSHLEELLGKKVKISVINYGASAAEYIRKLRASGVDVIVHQKMPRSEMPDFYRSLSLALMPSEHESLGLVALEAMSCGVPVVAFDICAFPEFVIDGVSGETVPYSEDLTERSEAMLRALEAMIPHLSEYNPERIVAERYSRDAVISFYRNL